MARKNSFFFIETLGCPKNLVDSEVISSNLIDIGFKPTLDPEIADIIIINTCGFINSAKEESIDVILDYANIHGIKSKKLIVTGCLVERYKKELNTALPEVNHFFDLHDINQITKILHSEEPYKDKRYLLTPHHYAYLRISDGCENYCTYCTIPSIRGKIRSKSIQDVVDEAKQLYDLGVKEIIVIAQDIGNYGLDLYGKSRLLELLKRLDDEIDVPWIRLLYLNPQHVSEELLYLVKTSKRICNYLDIPVQHISDSILTNMNRKVTRAEIFDKLNMVREILPNAAIRTSLIVGFPGETDEDFLELLAFVDKQKFERLGAFTYSQEEGTKAAHFINQIPEKIKKQRYEKLMKLQRNISSDIQNNYIGKEMKVIVDKKIKPKVYECRSEFDAPDIDGIVFLEGSKEEVGSFINVEIEDSLEYDLIAHRKE
ncbi:MAG TPA: 30S ribosomal protein S12 methylthiotransferase RimO [Candidatus Cloacimonetes bacterium]|nr:30S ribosomal protein S12 methylthiotransferase RimO [Candidatus Cloacimonadota bacterium]HEX38300.1 30S ribosomal protein S12 methylthiotransferase RimO [Candidatus Cloacimonadota bacterium]